MDNVHLVKRCQSGDREALGILYQTYLGQMRKVVAYYIHDEDVACDILHDGFVIAFTQIGSLKDCGRIEPWLTTIMRNLALRYLKDRAEHVVVALSETSVADDMTGPDNETDVLTREELGRIISRLPEGYGRVFRLAVLDGLSHREIGAMLGIAPHSSSSQLAHAKSMLRRMINQYRAGLGLLSLIAIVMSVWNYVLRHRDTPPPALVTDGIAHTDTPAESTDMITAERHDNGRKALTDKPKYRKSLARESVVATVMPADTVVAAPHDSVGSDTLRDTVVPDITVPDTYMAQADVSKKLKQESSGWSLSLAYMGNTGRNGTDRYHMANPDISDADTDQEIDVTENSRHHVPLIIGVSVNKSFGQRWSVETGLRYTFLQSDYVQVSRVMHRETTRSIHYIGVPLKLNYHIYGYGGLSLYGQGGIALDIPVDGRESVTEYSYGVEATASGPGRINAPLQWSADFGLGVQYQFSPSFGIYAEPSLRYYFNPGSGVRTIRQDRPVEFTVPIGLRLTW